MTEILTELGFTSEMSFKSLVEWAHKEAEVRRNSKYGETESEESHEEL